MGDGASVGAGSRHGEADCDHCCREDDVSGGEGVLFEERHYLIVLLNGNEWNVRGLVGIYVN